MKAFIQILKMDFGVHIAALNKAIQDVAASKSRHILFPDDKRTDKEVADHLRQVICKFTAAKRAGKIKPVKECKGNNL